MEIITFSAYGIAKSYVVSKAVSYVGDVSLTYIKNRYMTYNFLFDPYWRNQLYKYYNLDHTDDKEFIDDVITEKEEEKKIESI